MRVKVKTFANLKEIIGTQELSIDLGPGATLEDLLNTLMQKYGEPFERQIKDQMTRKIVPFLLLVNEKAYRSLTDLGTPLQEGDVITIMIPFDGG